MLKSDKITSLGAKIGKITILDSHGCRKPANLLEDYLGITKNIRKSKNKPSIKIL
jgi:hypothetical protein